MRPSPTMSTTTSFPRLMQFLAHRPSPALLWYSVPGERVELSGRVLDNWVSKTANLLAEECDLESGQLIALPKCLHWRSVILALAACRLGAQICFQQAQQPKVLVTFDPDDCQQVSAEHILVLAREPLAPRFPGRLPLGALDFAAEVGSQADVYLGFSEPSHHAKIWEGLQYGELLKSLATQAISLGEQVGEAQTALYIPGRYLDECYLQEVLATLSCGYAVLVLDPEAPWDDERLSRVLDDERAQLYPRPEPVWNRS